MLKLIRSLSGAIVAIASIGSNAQAQTPYIKTLGDPARQIDRPAGFGAFHNQPRSLYPIDSPETSTKCPKGSTPDSGCNSITTSNERSPSTPTPAAASLKNSPPVARQNSNSNNTLYRVRWSNSNKFKK